MEEDILKYSPTVMFRGTPCIKVVFNKSINSNSLYVVLIMLKKRLNVVVLHEIDQLFTASFPIHQLICSSYSVKSLFQAIYLSLGELKKKLIVCTSWLH